MFIIALFPIAKIWKQRKCPSMDEWVKKMWCVCVCVCVCVYIYTHTHTHTHTHTKWNMTQPLKRGNLAICDMDGP